jgi:hypothetical protein
MRTRSIAFVLRPLVAVDRRAPVRPELVAAVFLRLDLEGIEISL